MYRAVRIGERDGTRFKFEEIAQPQDVGRWRHADGTTSVSVGEIRRRTFRFVTVYVLGMFS